MKVRIGVTALLVVAAILAVVTIVSEPGEAAEPRPSEAGARRASPQAANAAGLLPALVASPWKRDEQNEAPLRYLVESRDGRPAVAALFYTGYSFDPELLGLAMPSTPTVQRLPGDLSYGSGRPSR
jgi:hypothetical protein